ncbi:MAG TPA: thermonuclease family protein [Gaiellaceae bacterium]|jgi:micrococcal nuclease|nr:thermonuclease family protein [Gaiellaceae bacterium]
MQHPSPAKRFPTLFAVLLVAVAAGIGLLVVLRHSRGSSSTAGWQVVDHVADGDTIVVRGGETVRLVQIDTPEVYFQAECFGEQASAETKRLLPKGSLVKLIRDPATDATDVYGRLLRYVVRPDGLDVNLRLVADGAAAPYFFEGVRGEYADVLDRDAGTARAARKGLWGACPGTQLAPDAGVSTGPP